MLFFAGTALAAISLPAASVFGDEAAPKAQPAAVFEAMASRSPFMAPTAPIPAATPPPVAAGPHWWDQLVVTSLMETGGVYFAAVVDKANNKRYVLESGKTDEESNLFLAEVQWNDRADQSTVTVRKGSEVAPPVRFDASAASAAPGSAPQPVNPARNPPAIPGLPPPPRFTTPPSPPATSVVHHSGAIGSRPAPPGSQGNSVMPSPPPLPPRRAIRPLSGNTDAGN